MSSQAPQQIVEIVRAGAGAGKTTQLIDKIIDFALGFKARNGSWPRVMATTFTVKATQEIRERLVVKACEKENHDLFSYVTSSKVQISTLDGIFSIFLTKYGHIHGLDPQFTIMSEFESRMFYKKVLRSIVLSDKSKKFENLFEFYSFQDMAKALKEYCLISERSDDLQKCNRDEYKELLKKHQKVLLLEVLNLLKEIDSFQNKKWVEYCDSLIPFLKSYLERAPFDGTIFLEELGQLTKKPASNKNFEKELVDKHKRSLENVKKAMEKPCFQLSNIDQFLIFLDKFEDLSHVFLEKIRTKKINEGVLEMSDLATITNEICKKQKELAYHFSCEWDFWCIDEYQDTSPIQVKILESLVGSASHYIVGDPQQSIYLFRGARSDLFELKQQEIRKTKGIEGFLQKNYRSEPSLLEFFNACFAGSSQFQKMEPRLESFDLEKPVAKIIISEKSKKEKRKYEILSVVSYIFELIEQGVELNEICILASTKKDLSKIARKLSEHGISNYMNFSSGFFQRREVLDVMVLLKFLLNPYDNYNLVALIRSPWLRVSDEQIMSICNKKNKYFWNILIEKYPSDDNVQKLQDLRLSTYKIGLMEVFVKAISELGYLDYSQFLDPTGRKEANIWKFVTLIHEESKKQGFNCIDFLDDCRNSTKNNSFTQEVLLESDAASAAKSNHINLMTVHGSKGLQFEHVIIFGLDKKFKESGSRSDKNYLNFDEKKEMYDVAAPIGNELKKYHSIFSEDIYGELTLREEQEFERSLYVAMTRAIKSVCLTASVSEDLDDLESLKDCWLSFLPIDKKEGLHKNKKFIYEVQKYTPHKNDSEDTQKKIHSDFLESREKKIKKPLRTPYDFKPSYQGLKKVSVSSFLEKNVEKSADHLISLSLSQIKKMNRGTNIHQALEILKYKEKVSDLYLKSIFEDETSFLEAKSAIEYVTSIDNPNFLTLIRQGEVEWGFQLLKEGQIIEGQIDLWGQIGKDIWVVDYKTGSQQYIEVAFNQLEYYAEAIGIKFNYKKFKLAVVYPLAKTFKVRDFFI